MEEQRNRRNLFSGIKNFGKKCARVFRVARKPTGNEVKQVSKISVIGLLIIGLIGFIISLIFLFFKLK